MMIQVPSVNILPEDKDDIKKTDHHHHHSSPRLHKSDSLPKMIMTSPPKYPLAPLERRFFRVSSARSKTSSQQRDDNVQSPAMLGVGPGNGRGFHTGGDGFNGITKVSPYLVLPPINFRAPGVAGISRSNTFDGVSGRRRRVRCESTSCVEGRRRSRSRSRSRRRKLFRENSRSAESGYRKRGFRNRYRTEHGSELDDEDYVTPINRFRKVARLVQLALIFYSGEGRTRGRKNDGNNEDHHAFFDKTDKMTFLPAFDPSLYKAQRIKELVVGADIKEILGKRPEDRGEEEIQQVLFALRTYETFAEYPLNMQERMCRKAHYLRFDANRIILRQGDRAEWFYYVLSGTTAVSILEENKTTGSVNLRNVGYLTRGTAFGELALLHGTRRTATVSCKDAVELIAVDKEDFVQMNQLDSDEEKEHVKYCRSLPILIDWPVSLLSDVTGICNFHFFKKGTVMAKSNHNTPFIYIVKSGHVRVLTKVTKIRQKLPAQGCRVRLRTSSSRTQASVIRSNRSDTSSSCSNGYRSRVNTLNSQSTNGAPPTHGSSRHMRGNLVPLISRLNVGEGTFHDVPIQPTFLQVCVLGAGDSFGLSTLVYAEEISCGIVSLGAECIEISKEFFVKNATENYLRKLKAMIRPFPSEDKLQQDIQDQKLWNNYKNTVVAQVLDPSSI